MGFLQDTFLGSRPDYRYMPGVTDIMRDLRGYNPTLGKAGKYYKGILKKLGSGADVSSYGQLNSVRQQGAAERRGISENYMTGGNALLAQSGPDQAGLLNRLRDVALEQSREREGMNTVNALANLSSEAGQGFQSAFNAKNQNILSKYGLLGQLNQQQYDARRQGGILQPLIGGVLGGLASFGLGGLGAVGGASSLPSSGNIARRLLPSTPTMYPRAA